jgi:hypothetical protein
LFRSRGAVGFSPDGGGFVFRRQIAAIAFPFLMLDFTILRREECKRPAEDVAMYYAV